MIKEIWAKPKIQVKNNKKETKDKNTNIIYLTIYLKLLLKLVNTNCMYQACYKYNQFSVPVKTQ